MCSNLSYLSKFKSHKNQKYTKLSFSLTAYYMICALHIDDHNDRAAQESNTLSSPLLWTGPEAECANHSAMKTHPHCKNVKLIDRRSNFVSLVRNHAWVVKILTIECISIALIRWNAKLLLTETLAFLAGIELK